MKAPWGFAASLAPTATPAAWGPLLDAMLHAVWLVDPHELSIVATNAAAGVLHGANESELIGRPVLDFAVTPEDHAFWRDAAEGLPGAIESDALVRRADGSTVAVTRRVSQLPSATGAALYVVALDDRSEQVRRERELEGTLAELQATLDSLGDGILVTDLRGRIRNFNRRFADLWELPDELLAQRADDALLDWMRRAVIDPGRYMRRLAAIDGATMLRASDVLTLHSGRVIERLTVPQCSRGRPIGRVYTFREMDAAVQELRPVA